MNWEKSNLNQHTRNELHIARDLAVNKIAHDRAFSMELKYDIEMYSHKKMKTDAISSLEVLQEMLPLFEAQEVYSNDSLYQTLVSYVEKKGCKNGYAMWPVRTAVSGKQMTPAGATEIMEIIGKEETLKRVKAAIEKLS